MNFTKGYIYHIYNQGNNKQRIFFNQKNYLFFIKKIKTYILPYADILAWCLMPNHFHLMVLVNEVSFRVESEAMTLSHHLTSKQKKRTLNESIAILLRSYTRAINLQQNSSGSLFRKQTKAICLNCPKGISPSWFTVHGITRIHISKPEKEYPQICFNYIHQNPVKAGIVKKIEDWDYSSAQDFIGSRNGKLINKTKAEEYCNKSELHLK